MTVDRPHLPDEREIELTYQKLVQASELAGSILIDSLLSTKSKVAIEVNVSLDELIAIITKCQPSIIYYTYNKLNPAEDIEDAYRTSLDTDESDEKNVASDAARKHSLNKLISSQRTKDFLARWVKYEGEFEYVEFSAVVSHVVHRLSSISYWHLQYNEELDSITDDLEEEKRSREATADKEASLKINAIAKKLAAHPLFIGGKARARVSREKRIFLAEELFPNEETSTHVKAVDTAAKLLWIESNGENA